MQSLQSRAALSRNQFFSVYGNVKTNPPHTDLIQKTVKSMKNFLLISKSFWFDSLGIAAVVKSCVPPLLPPKEILLLTQWL